MSPSESSPDASAHAVEVARGERFEFGANWARFLGTLDDERIQGAQAALAEALQCKSLQGASFLDVGSGSGLSSLAARRLGARVRSFDYDPQSVECTRELKRRYFPEDPDWRVEPGSALDEAFIEDLGRFDIVYSWGVLHHTGDMWTALDHAARPVAAGGRLLVAIYNDQGRVSRFWTKVKRIYNSGTLGRMTMLAAFVPWFTAQGLASGLLRHGNPLAYFSSYRQRRGMSAFHDWVDWLGGYPFEVAKPEEILDFYRERGFELIGLVTTNRLGCNEFLFQRGSTA